MQSLLVSALVVGCASLVSGQDSTPSSAVASSPVETGAGSAVATHVVTVGKDSNKFVPDSLSAKKGDIVQFQFFPPNHSVGRAEYQQPCIPYEDTGNNKVGFWSGFFPLSTVADSPPTWNLTINDTEPVFLYCAAPGSCINYQMVGVINPNSSVSLATQKQEAASSQFMLAPGQPFPSEESLPSGDVDPTTNSTSSSDAAHPSATSTASSNSLSKGGIAGIVVAAAVIALLAAPLFFLLGRHKTMLKFTRGSQYHSPDAQEPPMNQDNRSPHPAMSTYPGSPSAIPYSESPNYHASNYDSPPYTEFANYPSPAPFSNVIAELPSPRDKQAEEHMEMEQHPSERAYHDSPIPSPMSPQPKPLFWDRSKSERRRTSELIAELPSGLPTSLREQTPDR